MQPLAQQPAYIEAQQDLDKVVAAVAAIDTRLAEIDALLEEGRVRQARDLADVGLEFARTGVAVNPSTLMLTLQEERQALAPQRDALMRRILQRRDAQEEVRRALSVQASAQVQEKHVAILKRMRAALLAVDAVVEEEKAFFETLTALGYEPRFPIHAAWSVRSLGRAGDRHSHLFSILRELSNHTEDL